MHEPKEDPQILKQMTEQGYEGRDVKTDGLWKHAVAMYIFIGLSCLAAYIFLKGFDAKQASAPAPETLERARVPEGNDPLLQSNVTSTYSNVWYSSAMLTSSTRRPCTT